MKTELKRINENAVLFRDDKTGIAWVEDYATGTGHSCHANISKTGSVRGMKAQGYWGKHDRTERTHGFIYNIDTLVIHSPFDEIAAQYCTCQACLERRSNKTTAR